MTRLPLKMIVENSQRVSCQMRLRGNGICELDAFNFRTCLRQQRCHPLLVKRLVVQLELLVIKL